MFKFHKQELPSIFNNMFKTNSFYHSYETRNKSNYHYPFVRTSLTQHTLRFQGIHDWNSLPYNLKSSSTLSKFKYSCKQFLFKSNEVHWVDFFSSFFPSVQCSACGVCWCVCMHVNEWGWVYVCFDKFYNICYNNLLVWLLLYRAPFSQALLFLGSFRFCC